MTSAKTFLRDESGVAIVQYSIVLAFVAATVGVGLIVLGRGISDTLSDIAAVLPWY